MREDEEEVKDTQISTNIPTNQFATLTQPITPFNHSSFNCNAQQHGKTCIKIWEQQGIKEPEEWRALFPHTLSGQDFAWYLAHRVKLREWKELYQ